MVLAWKAGVGVNHLPGVRIPVSPPMRACRDRSERQTIEQPALIAPLIAFVGKAGGSDRSANPARSERKQRYRIDRVPPALPMNVFGS